MRPIFKFEHSIPAGSIIENATFCAYVYWGHCNQVAPRYMCEVGQVYASHIYVPGEIDVPDYNSTVLDGEKLWMPDLNGAPIGNGRYWCVDATNWVADDVANGRGSTSIRFHITQHHVIRDKWASQLRIYSRFNNFSQPYLEIHYSHEVPLPIGRSVIITDSEWRNVVSAAGVKVPVLVSESGGLTPEIGRFLEDYVPDYVYTIGFDSGFNNSFEIVKEDVSRLFFPNASGAVYANSREKGIFASLIGSYLGMPVVFDKVGNYSEFLDLESMSIEEIQELYLQRVKEKFRGIVDYLVLTDIDSEEGLLAGRLASMRDGYIVPVGDKSILGIKLAINESIEHLGCEGFYHRALGYKKGSPLFLAILGGNGSVPYVSFFDPGMEIFDNKDGWSIYSDLLYSDSNMDGFFDLATGRMEGLEAASIHMARQSLPQNQSAVLIGEYRHSRIEDLKFFGGGLTQAFLAQLVLESTNVSTKRIVEGRFYLPGQKNESLDKALEGAAEFVSRYLAKKMLQDLGETTFLGIVGRAWAAVDIGDMVMYAVFEFDWLDWMEIGGVPAIPKHLEVIDGDLGEKIGSPGMLGYFGLGESGWTIPKANRSYWEMLLVPYWDSTEFENLTFSSFLYDDHDMSASSSIKESVVGEGGSVAASSGIVHDPYTMHTSTVFFGSLAHGKPLGQALIDSAKIDPMEGLLGFIFFYQVYSQLGQQKDALTYPLLYAKDKFERILFGDPAIVPVLNAPKAPRITYIATPFHSFKTQSWIQSNYTMENGSLFVWNADDYLTERERPITPVFVREFILPEGAAVNWVNVSGSYSLEEIEPEIVYNDSYYTNYTEIILDCIDSLGLGNMSELDELQEGLLLECLESAAEPNVSYPYPNSTFWWSSHSLLDNRTLVYVFVPSVLQENGSWARVLENASVEVDYEAQVEMNVFVQNVLLGENGTVRIELMNLGGETSGKVWVFVEGNGNFEFSENVTIPENSSLMEEFSFAPELGDYEIVAVFEAENGSIGPRHAYFSVHEAIAIPEVNGSGVFEIRPGRYSERSFSVRNSGNAVLEMGISCEGFVGISCEIAPGNLDVLPGGEESFSVNMSVPGGHPAGEYSGKIIITGNELAEPRTVEIALNVSVPETAYWSLYPLEWVCNLPMCVRNFSVINSLDSNIPLNADIAVEGLDMVSTESQVSVGSGEEKNVTALAEIPDEGIMAGVYSGNITFEAGGSVEPSVQKINVTLIAGGPEFTLEKEFSPKKVLLFWKQFAVPKINHVEIYLNNTEDVPIEKINVSDEVPEGWKGRKPVLSFVKRNMLLMVKEFNYSYGNGYANFSFDFSGNPLQKGEGLQIHYLIYAQPEYVPAGNIVTNVSGEARSHENIYSRTESSATLKVDYFNPPVWLRWLFVLFYRLW